MGQALCCVQVNESSLGIKETFGKFDDILYPGCHCLPWLFVTRVAGYVSLRVKQLDVRCETKTKDDVFVTVVASVHYRAVAQKAVNAFYTLNDSESQIKAYVFDGVNGKHRIDIN
ncbi:hypothetical protein IFM89_004959 [Coptis chinensis]|uniref:Band 7 domain-containing protein n=1 Tax=Coptis chinensis TaxID=261450 RepID=A0A835LQF1_9MAGN|nr:hypothetical protein IFM89_004959 [Coptis chinensis]